MVITFVLNSYLRPSIQKKIENHVVWSLHQYLSDFLVFRRPINQNKLFEKPAAAVKQIFTKLSLLSVTLSVTNLE